MEPTMPDRRRLDFRTFSELRNELARLRNKPYDRAGNWSLGQNCRHINTTMTGSMDGFDVKVPAILRWIAPVALAVTLKRRRMPAGVKGPAEWMPATLPSDEAEVDALLQTIQRYEDFTGDLHPSPLFGKLPRAKWDQLHLIHASHHFGFIVPRE
jgi:hypothetical protein